MENATQKRAAQVIARFDEAKNQAQKEIVIVDIRVPLLSLIVVMSKMAIAMIPVLFVVLTVLEIVRFIYGPL